MSLVHIRTQLALQITRIFGRAHPFPHLGSLHSGLHDRGLVFLDGKNEHLSLLVAGVRVNRGEFAIISRANADQRLPAVADCSLDRLLERLARDLVRAANILEDRNLQARRPRRSRNAQTERRKSQHGKAQVMNAVSRFDGAHDCVKFLIVAAEARNREDQRCTYSADRKDAAAHLLSPFFVEGLSSISTCGMPNCPPSRRKSSGLIGPRTCTQVSSVGSVEITTRPVNFPSSLRKYTSTFSPSCLLLTFTIRDHSGSFSGARKDATSSVE